MSQLEINKQPFKYDSCRESPISKREDKSKRRYDDKTSLVDERRKSLVDKIFESEHKSQREDEETRSLSKNSFVNSTKNMKNELKLEVSNDQTISNQEYLKSQINFSGGARISQNFSRNKKNQDTSGKKNFSQISKESVFLLEQPDNRQNQAVLQEEKSNIQLNETIRDLEETLKQLAIQDNTISNEVHYVNYKQIKGRKHKVSFESPLYKPNFWSKKSSNSNTKTLEQSAREFNIPKVGSLKLKE